ncbi:hypothetical protein KIPE111705_39005 [Kibdelosporangium persicum]|uniref:Uncharacterized protein n=1 Tax=Kibdelosporangium persicum TaxID=2698649 RepID=A0ABX2FA74_9PSEU|nr:hypothetical protein [Kibdelosporangium persicum]NRN67801.1 hypothetical protein [Kibdelosporangium persicum]
MRKLLSAGVLATVAALLPVFTAQATPVEDGYSSESKWIYVEDYFHLIDCRDDGELGQDAGIWGRYRCEFRIVPGEWLLFVTDLHGHGHDGDHGDHGDHHGDHGDHHGDHGEIGEPADDEEGYEDE